MTGFFGIRRSVVVAIGVQIVRRQVPVSIDRRIHVSLRCCSSCRIDRSVVVGVIQTIIVQVNTRWWHVASGRLSFDIVRDAIVVAVQITVIANSVAVGI